VSVFVDSGVFYALHDEDTDRHRSARGAFDRLLVGTYGSIVASDYVYDETVTLTRSRFGTAEDALAAGDRILGRRSFPDTVDLRFVDRPTFESAIDLLARYDDQPLSFTDATTVALVEQHDIDHVLAFDDDFDGVVDRLDPATVAGA